MVRAEPVDGATDGRLLLQPAPTRGAHRERACTDTARWPLPVWPAAGVLAAVSVATLVLVTPVGAEQRDADVANIVELLLSSFACGTSLWRAARSAGHRRTAWLAAAVGCGGWAVGQGVWSWYEVVERQVAPFPSVADPFFLLLPAAMSLALLRLPGRGGWRQRRRLLDALTVTTSLALVSWSTVMRAVVEAGGDDPLAFVPSSRPAPAPVVAPRD